MDKIDITTSHNIVVTVELANSTQRILATCLDLFIVGIYCSIAAIFSSSNDSIYMILVMPVILCYHLIFEYYNDGQSLGKRLLKLKVVSLSGERPSLLDLVMRWMFRMVDITFSAGLLAIMFISSTKKKQRVGDILANTTVVRLENESYIELKSIKSISDDKYKVTYPQVIMYKDSDMLLVKEAIRRYNKRQTNSNTKILFDLYKKIVKDFNIKVSPNDRIKFLRTVLNDYVVLTR